MLIIYYEIILSSCIFVLQLFLLVHHHTLFLLLQCIVLSWKKFVNCKKFCSLIFFCVFISFLRDFIINISWDRCLEKKSNIKSYFQIIFTVDDKETYEASTCGKILIFLSWVLVFLTMPFSLLVCFKVSRPRDLLSSINHGRKWKESSACSVRSARNGFWSQE